ncbi:hypothetical protein L1987_61444 [Smallanthus sonchifolius]|uniref:Uncharacterized protein n=1 Tax=Smallanthus sonchifolius TaxID=185202 RepID=A0ACB9C7Q9_9ASTR|nr:hypothetical protein L1987_61444 [Smallanthus sonchifolius]
MVSSSPTMLEITHFCANRSLVNFSLGPILNHVILIYSESNPKTPANCDQAMKGGKSSGAVKKTDGKLAVKKTAAKAKAAKDPNKPKRPASAFFVFMEGFRKQFKEENPDNKSVAAVGKAGGVKWKSMSVAEKAPYVAKAEKRKTEYEKNMTAYNKKQAAGGDDEDDDSDKSKSEINNEEEDSDDEEDDD